MAAGELLPPRQYPGVPGRIHTNDLMMPAHRPEHVPGYLAGGLQVSELVGANLATAVPDGAARGVDLGSGHGRVLRHLVRDHPDIRWTAADVDRSAVRFCRQEFGVRSVRSSRRFNELELPDAPYDVVWMGSLVTHLQPSDEDELWAMLRRSTSAPGLLVFSTMGPACLDDLDRYAPGGSAQRARMAADLAATGRAYLQYPHYRRTRYGITLHDADAISARVVEVFGPGATRLDFRPAGWLMLQDLHAFRVGTRP
jgi:SAM-dependent methyltransferase